MGRFLSDQCKLSPASIAWLNLVQIDTSSPPAFSISSPSPYLFQGYNMDDRWWWCCWWCARWWHWWWVYPTTSQVTSIPPPCHAWHELSLVSIPIVTMQCGIHMPQFACLNDILKEKKSFAYFLSRHKLSKNEINLFVTSIGTSSPYLAFFLLLIHT